MKAVVIHAAKDLRIEEREAEEPGPGQVLVRVAMGGICGSDLHYYNHGGFGAVRLKEPMILGHEVSGHVEALGAGAGGPGIGGLTLGDLVAVSPSRPCHACRFCLMGMTNHCLNMRFYGSAMPFPHIQGAFREHLVADAAQCVRAEGLSAAEAAMAEPLAVALHAVGQAGEVFGRRVLVTGCGPIGCLAIIAARRAGAAEIVATDLSAFTLGLAEQVGADRAINVSETGLADYHAEKGQFDVLLECSGAQAAVTAAVPALRPKGVVVQVGIGGDMTLPMQAVTAKEIEIRGSFRFHPEFGFGVGLMQRGLADVRPLITHAVPLAEAEQAFHLANDRTRAMKAQIVFS